ncbi:MAG: hypothetical protein IPK78_18990 [Rhodospirillales bacterium]|nr:hypothetical protein [Rhodospirillales bacterium]
MLLAFTCARLGVGVGRVGLDQQQADISDFRGVAGVRRVDVDVELLFARRCAEAQPGDAEDADPVLRARRLLALHRLLGEHGCGLDVID